MRKKNIALGLFAIFLMAIVGVVVVNSLMTVTQGDTVTVEKEVRCIQRQALLDMVIDTDSSDGKVVYIYGAWVLKDPNSTIVQEGLPTQLLKSTTREEGYKPNTTFIADKIGTYTFGVSTLYAEAVINETGDWEIIYSGVCGNMQETVNVNYPPVNLAQILEVINSLYENWKSGL